MARLKEAREINDKAKIASEIHFYNKDIIEIIEEARKHISEQELGDFLDELRSTFNFYRYII